MGPLYPLKFRPVFKNYIWGGRRLSSVLGKELPDDQAYAESWEIVDHKDGQSVVSEGNYVDWTLSRLVTEKGEELLGKHHPQAKFPLLFKFLDCQRSLSLQVHPNDQQGSKLDPPDLGKTEAWVVMAAEPGSSLYAGLKSGIDRAAFQREIENGTADTCVQKITPNIGDCIFIPAGAVHALGEGLLIAEIQQSSNTTFRLFDWNRVDADGNSRPLHIEEGLDVTDFEHREMTAQQPVATAKPDVERIVECEKFVLDRATIESESLLGGDDACHILAVMEGEITIGDVSLRKGETALLPASCGELSAIATSTTTLLDMYLP